MRLTGGIVVFLITLAVYFFTLAPGVTLVDSGELITASVKMGVAHPPGFPLYTFSGFLFSKLPFQSPAFALNFMSALFSSAGAFLVYLISYLIISKTTKNLSDKTIVLICAGASLIWSFSISNWFYSTISEVYSLNTLLLLSVIYFLLKFNELKKIKYLYFSGLFFGLSLCVHIITSILFLPAIVFLIYKSKLKKTPILKFIACIFLGLTAYIYLPLAAGSDPVLNWGKPDNPASFLKHISARQYQSYLFEFNVKNILSEVYNFVKLWLTQSSFLIIPVSIYGFWKFREKNIKLFWFFALIFAFNVAYGIFYTITDDKDAYYLPAFFITVFGFGAGIGFLIESYSKYTLAIISSCILLSCFAFYLNYPASNKEHTIANLYVYDSIKNLDKNSLVLTADWQLYSPWLYLRHVENFRQDVLVLDMQLLKRSWYLDYVTGNLPFLSEKVAENMNIYKNQVMLFENGRDYESNSIQKAYIDFVNSLVDFYTEEGRSVYFSSVYEKEIGEGYVKIPDGLNFKLVKNGEQINYQVPSFSLRRDNRDIFRSDESARDTVYRNYSTMLYNHGLYFDAQKDTKTAILLYEQALEYDPGNKKINEKLLELRLN